MIAGLAPRAGMQRAFSPFGYVDRELRDGFASCNVTVNLRLPKSDGLLGIMGITNPFQLNNSQA